MTLEGGELVLKGPYFKIRHTAKNIEEDSLHAMCSYLFSYFCIFASLKCFRSSNY